MWVLTPIIRSGASQRPSDGSGGGAGEGDAAARAAALSATLNVNHFLVSGPLVVGRAGAGRGADIEVHGDKSVSAAHATLALEASPPGGSCVSITDTSSFGTLVNDKRLAKGQAVRLAANDALRLADRSKFRLLLAPLELHAPHAGTAAAVAHNAEALGVPLVPWGPPVSHCVVEEGCDADAATACALLGGIPLVTPAWLAAIRGRKVWAGALPPEADYAPGELALAAPQGQRRGERLRLAEWRAPPAGALGAWAFAIPLQDTALNELASMSGAQVMDRWLPGATPPDAPAGRTLVWVASGSLQLCTADTVDLGAPCVDVATLVHAALLGDVAPLQAAAQAHEAAAVAAAAAAAAAAEEEEGGTQGTATDGEGGKASEDAGEETTLLEVAHQQQRRGASVSGRSLRGASAGDGQAAPGPAATTAAGGSGGRKRPAGASAAASADNAGSPSKRTRQASGAAGAAAGRAASSQAWDAGGAQQQAQPAGGSGDLLAPDAAEGRPPVVVEQLIVASPQRSGSMPTTSASGKAARGRAGKRRGGGGGGGGGTGSPDVGVPNFKAFRRKGQGLLGSGGSGGSSSGHLVQRAPLEVYTDQRRMDAEAQAIAKEEQLRAKRMKKADELFNANIRPAKVPPLPKPPPTKRRVPG